MTYRPARLALLLGSIIARRWGISSISDFDDFFPTQSLASQTGVRKRQFDFLLSSHLQSARMEDREAALETLERFGIPSTSASSPEGEDAERLRMGETSSLH